MKIAFDISQIIYEGTGVANYTKNLIENLVKLDQEEFILFGSSFRKFSNLSKFYKRLKNSGKKIEDQFFHIPQTILNKLWNSLHILTIENLIGDIDILHSSDWIQPPTKAKKITTIHDLVIYKYPEVSDPNIITTQKKRLSWVKKECDYIIADSFSTKADIVNILKISPEKIEVIYPGVDDSFKIEQRDKIEKVKQKYNIAGDYILSVGTIEPRKNLKKVLDAFEYFSNHSLVTSLNKPIELVLVGKSGWGEDIELPRYARKVGYVDEELLPALYSGALMFVYPSLYEGFGLPILEAMKCGVPVITSNRGSLKEIAENAALYVDPQDERDIGSKIVQLFVDNNLKKGLQGEGLTQAKKFNWDETAKKTLSLYRKLGRNKINKS